MGIDFYKCDSCGDVHSDCTEYTSCVSCHKSWCPHCFIKPFYYDGILYCDLCFSTEPAKITTEDMLVYLLEKVGCTQEEIELEMSTLPKYTQPQHTYKCTAPANDHETPCGGDDCMQLTYDYDADDEIQRRGICCASRHPLSRLPKHRALGWDWCDGCMSKLTTKKIKIGE